MNLQQLEYFKKIAETKNFTTAAELSSITQPAISKAISKLEVELNVSLFERKGHSVTLTSFGEVFLKHANLALLEIDKGIHELQSIVTPDNGTISISSTYCINAYFIPFIISDFLSSYPETKFQFNSESTPKILYDLRNGKIDIGFYDDINDLPSYTEILSLPIKKEEYVLIVPKNHLLSNKTHVSLKDLKNESFIVFCEENKDKLLSYSEFLKYTPKISLQPSQVSMLGGLVAAGAGITIVPNTPLINTNTISIVNIKEDIGYKTIYMGWHKDSNMLPIVKKFRDYIISNSLIR